jgi:hypothetical protein
VVRFTVDNEDAGGTGTTDAGGRSEFCYDGPIAPRTDRIRAYADTDGDRVQSAGEPAGSASKAWVVPASRGSCKVKGSGSIHASNGDPADFRLALQVHNGRAARGSVFFEDLGPVDPLVLRSARITSVACASSSAAVFGRTHGSSPVFFRIDVVDGDEDRFRTRVSNGYDSGDEVLADGDIRVR